MGLTNNDIFKKLRVALQLRDDEIVDILKKADYYITKSELGAFFRNEDHPKYMQLQDQILRNFLNGLIIHKRGPAPTGKKMESPLREKKQAKRASKPNTEPAKPQKFKADRKPETAPKPEKKEAQKPADNPKPKKTTPPGKFKTLRKQGR